MKLLVLEDDKDLSSHLARMLGNEGHVVDVCASGQDAIFHGSDTTYDVMILDRMVLGLDGLKALKAMRAAGIKTPALFLTAMGGVQDRVAGLEAGADDYLTKPFAMSELLARINALARRPPLSAPVMQLAVGDLRMDVARHEVTRDGKRIELHSQEFKLLEYLMRHPGEVVTRAMLLDGVWSFHFDPRSNIIESHMSRLRAKIDRGFEQELIHTVRGAGYRINAPT